MPDMKDMIFNVLAEQKIMGPVVSDQPALSRQPSQTSPLDHRDDVGVAAAKAVETHVHLKTAEGQPIAHAEVRIIGNGQEATAAVDEKGHARATIAMSALSGPVGITVHVDSKGGDDAGPDVRAAIVATLPAGLNFRVLGPDGKPVADAQIEIASGDTARMERGTDGEGKAHFDVSKIRMEERMDISIVIRSRAWIAVQSTEQQGV